MSRVGAKLRELRRRRNLVVRELAVRSGVSHSTISLIERDMISPSVDTLTAIVDALGGTLTAFFSGIEPEADVSRHLRANDKYVSGDIGGLRLHHHRAHHRL